MLRQTSAQPSYWNFDTNRTDELIYEYNVNNRSLPMQMLFLSSGSRKKLEDIQRDLCGPSKTKL